MIINTNKTKTEDALILQEKKPFALQIQPILWETIMRKKMDCLKPRVKDCKSLIIAIPTFHSYLFFFFLNKTKAFFSWHSCNTSEISDIPLPIPVINITYIVRQIIKHTSSNSMDTATWKNQDTTNTFLTTYIERMKIASYSWKKFYFYICCKDSSILS